MIRMTLMLSAAVGLTLVIAGQDTGQVRAGLANARELPQAASYRYIPVPQQEKIMTVAAKAQATPALPVASVKADALNLRAAPSGAVIGRLTQGEEVSVVTRKGDWTLIRMEGDGGEGWVATDYLSADPAPILMAGN